MSRCGQYPHSETQPHSHQHEQDAANSCDHSHTHQHTEVAAKESACCSSHSHAAATPFTPSAAATVIDGHIQTAIRIMQMDCPTEEALIRKKLGEMAAVRSLEFNLMQRVLTVVHTPQSLEPILAALRSLGFEPELADGSGKLAQPAANKKPLWPLIVAGVAALLSESAGWLGYAAWLSAALALVAVALCGLGTYKKGWVSIKSGSLNINALMSIAVTGAIVIGHWSEAAMVMVLFTLAELIEARSLDRARNAIAGLMSLAPDTATVQQADGSWQEIAAANVAVGSMVRVKPGERIGLDGEIVRGRSTVDQAPITGESLPVEKNRGDAVFAGTINQAGLLEYRVIAAASHSTLARIIHAVEEAQGVKAPTQRFVDRFAQTYTPAVLAIAALIAVVPPLFLNGAWSEWVYKALVLLVIACPCALVISTPVSIVSGLAAAARKGILVKGGVYLEQGRKLKWLALDKTGTLTHGKPVQTDFAVLGNRLPENGQVLASSLAAHSDHPVSQAIARAAAEQGITTQTVHEFTALAGRGVQGEIDGVHYVLGNHRLIHERGLCSAELENRLAALEREGKTVVLLANETQVLALFAVADTVKESSREAIAQLHQLGINTLMLSGDNPHTAAAIAAQVGIDRAYGDQLPQDKLAAVEKLAAEGAVGMVGDGINDAPALARADIGFAMGAMGTDTAIETADVALMDDDLRKIPAFVRLSQATHAVLVQNIVLALAIKAVFLALTIAGFGTMWMAVFADVGASLLVVGNGLRLLRK